MADWGEVEVYYEMIDELKRFAGQISQACEVMDAAASTCQDTMEDDTASQKAASNIKKSEKQYLEAARMAIALAKELDEEAREIINYLKLQDQMDGGSE